LIRLIPTVGAAMSDNIWMVWLPIVPSWSKKARQGESEAL